jgi:hypothetical protein
MPILFRAQSPALHVVKTHNLFALGAQVEECDHGGKAWRIVIYTDQPGAVLEFLSRRMPGIQWAQSTVSP